MLIEREPEILNGRYEEADVHRSVLVARSVSLEEACAVSMLTCAALLAEARADPAAWADALREMIEAERELNDLQDYPPTRLPSGRVGDQHAR